MYERAVPSSVKFREAYARGVPLVQYDRFNAGAEAYRAAARAFLGDAAAEVNGGAEEAHPPDADQGADEAA